MESEDTLVASVAIKPDMKENSQATLGDMRLDGIEEGPDDGLFRNSLCLMLTVTRIPTTKSVPNSQVEVDADKQMFHVYKNLLKSPLLSAIDKLDAAKTEYLKARCLPSPLFRGGIWLLSLAMVPEVDTYLKDYIEKRKVAVEALAEGFEDIIKESEGALRVLFDSTDYPTKEQVKSYFTVSKRYFTFRTPKSLLATSPDIFKAALADARADMSMAVDEGKALLRTTVAQLTGHLLDKLTPGDDGKKKILRPEALAKLQEALSIFDKQNIYNDSDLKKEVEKLKATVAGDLTTEQIRNSEQLKATLTENLTAIKSELDKLVTVKPARKLDM